MPYQNVIIFTRKWFLTRRPRVRPPFQVWGAEWGARGERRERPVPHTLARRRPPASPRPPAPPGTLVPGDAAPGSTHLALAAGRGPAVTKSGTSAKVGSKIPTPRGGLSKGPGRTYSKR